MVKLTCFLFLLTSIIACSINDGNTDPKTGTWRGAIELQGKELPFNFELVRDSTGSFDVYLINAGERLLLDEVSVSGDSIDIGLHIFDANFVAKIEGDSMRGIFVKNYEKDYKLPFRAAYGQAFRFVKAESQERIPDFSGKFDVTFWSDTSKAVGVFEQKDDSVTGTFLTETGDYRFLQGNVANGKLQLSTFDGNHAYLFTATKNQDGSLNGEFTSGKTFYTKWSGVPDADAKLADPESLTSLKEGFEKIEFSFPDVNGNTVSLNDARFANKVVIVQLLGTWCPNCMDETRFLSEWYRKNQDRGVEIIGLAYERKSDFGYASTRVKKMIDKLEVPYLCLIAGTSDKQEASRTLPQLTAIAAFPTTIFVGKDGKVKKIHTGFSGPGTGLFYDQFIEHFNESINSLLSQDVLTSE